MTAGDERGPAGAPEKAAAADADEAVSVRDGVRLRRDAASGEVMAEARLIRFVAAPDDRVVPDLSRRLPGRGVWVEARREAVLLAVKKGAFPRGLKRPARAGAELADEVEALLTRRCLELLGLARRAGVLISGFEKVSARLADGSAAWLVEASDGSADGRRKILSAARSSPRPPRICGAFSADELGLALGRGHAIHSAFLAGRWAERWGEALERFAGFRPLLPESWSEEPPRPTGREGEDKHPGSGGRDGRRPTIPVGDE